MKSFEYFCLKVGFPVIPVERGEVSKSCLLTFFFFHLKIHKNIRIRMYHREMTDVYIALKTEFSSKTRFT